MPFRSVWLYGLFIKTLEWGLKSRSEFMAAIKIKIKITKIFCALETYRIEILKDVVF